MGGRRLLQWSNRDQTVPCSRRTVDGIGPWVNRLYRVRHRDGRIQESGLVSRAHAAGLAVHPYTFRQDDLPPGFESFRELLKFVIDELSVDGLFTDFPDLVKTHLGASAADGVT